MLFQALGAQHKSELYTAPVLSGSLKYIVKNTQ